MKLFLLAFLFVNLSTAFAAEPTAGLHLMTYQSWGYNVDAGPQGDRVRRIIGQAKELGFKEVIFNFRGHMVTGTSAEIRSSVPPEEQPAEEKLLLETVAYAKGLGLNVAFRPILLVVGPKGEFPYGKAGRTWWHGNIQPKDPKAWFAAYFRFHERYLRLAKAAGASWYSIGAEMNSMTTGRGIKRGEQARGFPREWVKLIEQAKAILGPATKVTYGVNYTDQATTEGGTRINGGEIEQWRYFLTETFRKPADLEHQAGMIALWNALDSIGIDYYRALSSDRRSYPTELKDLSALLKQTASSHANQLDNSLTEISLALGVDKPVYFQEMGYRSAEESFVKPASYESRKGVFSELHQAAAWDAFLGAYWDARWPWFEGVGLWQVLVDSDIEPSRDTGFNPIGKPLTEQVLRGHFQR